MLEKKNVVEKHRLGNTNKLKKKKKVLSVWFRVDVAALRACALVLSIHSFIKALVA